MWCFVRTKAREDEDSCTEAPPTYVVVRKLARVAPEGLSDVKVLDAVGHTDLGGGYLVSSFPQILVVRYPARAMTWLLLDLVDGNGRDKAARQG